MSKHFTVYCAEDENPANNGNETWNSLNWTISANNQDDKRSESITVKLLADGKKIGKKLVLNATNN